MALTKPGDTIMSMSAEYAGHVTHRPLGAAGLYGLTVKDIPFRDFQVDVEALEREAASCKPKLLIIGGSLPLFPYDVAALRAVADKVGAKLMYDAAHVSGLMAGGYFQRPLHEGAHIM